MKGCDLLAKNSLRSLSQFAAVLQTTKGRDFSDSVIFKEHMV